MAPADKGRFCASCQKNVVDFTRSSDREIGAAFSKTNNICGRFRNDQLNRDLFLPKEKNKLWVTASVAVLGFLGLATHDVKAQEPPVSEQNQPSAERPKQKLYGPGIATGKITSNDTLSIEFAGISNKTAHTFALSDSEGNFSIEASLGDSIEIYHVGYETLNFVFDGDNLIVIELEKADKPPYITLGGAIMGINIQPAENSIPGNGAYHSVWDLFR